MIPVEAYIIPLKVTVKARAGTGNKRVVEVEASSESVDAEGDVVLQKALLDSAASFIRSGHLDIDHLSEIGSRIGIRDPDSYIVGRPVEVVDLGSKRTGVVGEIMRSRDGVFDTAKNRFDAFWNTLQSEPPVQWSASIYGFPSDIDDCTEKSCTSGATRFVIKALDWRSMAFTRNPVNTSLNGYAKVVTAKAMVEAMQKDRLGSPFALSDNPAPATMCAGSMPTNLDGLWGNYQRHGRTCPYINGVNSVATFKDHFMGCCGASTDVADIMAHALMYMIMRERRRN